MSWRAEAWCSFPSKISYLTGLGLGLSRRSMSTKGHTLVNRIDTHFHMLPQFWINALIKKTGKPASGVPDWSFGSALAIMNRLETRTAIVFLATSSVSVWEGQEQLDITKQVNDFGLELVAKANGRLGYFATLPMPNVEHSVAEVARAYDSYNADGVILISSYKGVYLGDKIFDPVWAELNNRKAVVSSTPASLS